MRENVFLLMVLGLSILLFAACKDDTSIEDGLPNISETVLDSMDIYRIQTDKSVMINHLIRFQSGRYSLDLSKEDAEKIGISTLMYNQVIEHVNLLNESYQNQQ